jgi:hypothetical protein
VRRVVRKHEDELAGWLECATRAIRDQAECLRKAECDDREESACDQDLDDVCGEAPEPASTRIDEDIDRLCPEPIDCEDGSVAQGRFCNEQLECDDGSDEAFCDDDGSSAGGTAAGFMMPVSSVGPVPEALFECDDGTPLPVAFVCDGLPQCQDGSDEQRCFRCLGDGRTIRGLLQCDGIPDCADASDESGCNLGPAGAGDPSVQECLQVTPATSALDPSCIACVCNLTPKEALLCDSTCWALVACILDACPDAPGGSNAQTECALRQCADHLAGAMPATLVGPTLRDLCASVCPP